ncbi:MAG: hypothetical protein QOH84_2544 [Kribbellaceae bacterium]|nr:hypothetical protein [Kribbellaceae bacterium]
MDPQPRPARSDPTPFRSYRSQLTLALITLGVFLVGLVSAIVAGVWALAAQVAVFVAGWIARVLMVLRINRLGGYTADPRPDTRAHYRPVLRTQLVGWILVSIYFVITGFWWGLLTSVTLGLFSLLLLRVIPKR